MLIAEAWLASGGREILRQKALRREWLKRNRFGGVLAHVRARVRHGLIRFVTKNKSV